MKAILRKRIPSAIALSSVCTLTGCGLLATVLAPQNKSVIASGAQASASPTATPSADQTQIPQASSTPSVFSFCIESTFPCPPSSLPSVPTGSPLTKIITGSPTPEKTPPIVLPSPSPDATASAILPSPDSSLSPEPTTSPTGVLTPAPSATPSTNPTGTPSPSPTPNQSFAPLATPTNLRVSAVTSDSVTLSWDAVSGAKGYEIYKNGKSALFTGYWSTETSAIIEKLTPATTYQLTVAANRPDYEGGGSSPSLPVSVLTRPAEPSSLSEISSTENSMVVGWPSVSGANSYRIYKEGALLADNLTSNSFQIQNLTQDTDYNISLAAVNESGESTSVSRAIKIFTPLQINNDNPALYGYRLVRNQSKRFNFNVKAGNNYKVMGVNTASEGAYLYVNNTNTVGANHAQFDSFIYGNNMRNIDFRAEKDGVMYVGITDGGNTSGSDGYVRVVSFNESLDAMAPSGGSLSPNSPVSFSLAPKGIVRYSFNMSSGVDYKITTTVYTGGTYIYSSKISCVDQYINELHTGSFYYPSTTNGLSFRAWESGVRYIALVDDNNTSGSTGTIKIEASP